MRNKILAGIGAIALLTLPITAHVFMPGQASADSSESYRQLNLFGDVFERVRADYVREVTDQELIESAINGMLTSLDPHSSFLNKKNYTDMKVQTRGQFGGLGIQVTMENGYVKVISPIDDTPAFRAGVKAGDMVTHIDKESVLGLTLSQAVEKMRGKVNTAIALTIRRVGEEKPLEISITRAIIKVQSVKSRVEGNAAYIRITSFSEQTEKGLKKALKELTAKLGDKMTGVVLDLRSNPGGLLDQAVLVSDAFLDQGEIVSTRGRDNKNVQRFSARDGDLSGGKPVVVLVNGGSASASEIVAGALQDHKRAIVMGTKSFGKGSVQTIMPLSAGTAMRLTTSLYYTPSGRSIQKLGITPDILVPQAKVELLEARPSRSEASLRNAIRNGNGKKDAKKNDPAAKDPAAKPNPADGAAAKTKEAEKPQDYQLTRAVDLLQGIALYQNAAAE
ncbi:MAG: S41 family peptidase [Alphaproteobacteria bacterium]|jgi:carboxyl-terminal processing protease|nr:S41 family peptidase [Alphaproteobacteria bacterium]MBT4082887.1 S41 family peptidase [Alphaproteobacteria bacterium]MBT4544408.1 S41 family peptidase [Alphaproteobacteria bacterium]MBT5918158.1 S41 family peptidase [Alphaproteobacteria bacterium]MBT6386906.1 S41 family peptidase [Alphaproteobacteria bacterium]